MKTSVIPTLYVTLAILLSPCAAVTSNPKAVNRSIQSSSLVLTSNGQSKYVIALATDAIPTERNAADQLCKYIQKISGVTLAVHDEASVSSATPQILVGAGTRAKQLLPKQDWNALGTDGIVIKTVGNQLILAGGRPRGTLYAVNSFLEDTLGVRWWTETESTIPQKSTLKVPIQKWTFTCNASTRFSVTIRARWVPGSSTRIRWPTW